MLVIDASMETPGMSLKQRSCIQYLVKFCKNKETVQALINSDNEIIAIILA